MPELLRIPIAPGSASFGCFRSKAFAGDQDEVSPGFPIAQADIVAIYYTTNNTANDVVDIPMVLQISSDGQFWEDAGENGILGGDFTNPFQTITLASGDETKWTLLVNVPSYALQARIRLESGVTTVGCEVTVHAIVGRSISRGIS